MDTIETLFARGPENQNVSVSSQPKNLAESSESVNTMDLAIKNAVASMSMGSRNAP